MYNNYFVGGVKFAESRVGLNTYHGHDSLLPYSPALTIYFLLC